MPLMLNEIACGGPTPQQIVANDGCGTIFRYYTPDPPAFLCLAHQAMTQGASDAALCTRIQDMIVQALSLRPDSV
jgi:hypothetical protein